MFCTYTTSARSRAASIRSAKRMGLANPPSRAAESIRCPARATPSKRASSSSVIQPRPACRLRCLNRIYLDATAPMSACASIKRASAHSTASCSERRHRGGARTACRQAGGALAQRRAADTRARARQPGATRSAALGSPNVWTTISGLSFVTLLADELEVGKAGRVFYRTTYSTLKVEIPREIDCHEEC